MRPGTLRIFFASVLILAGAFVAVTSSWLPDLVASHFDGAGAPNGWMTRNAYRLVTMAFAVGLPLFVTLAIALCARLIPARYVNIPNKHYWLAPERRAQSLEFLGVHAMWLGCVMALFSAGVHWITMRANASTPPHLDNRMLFVLLGAFVVALIAWIAVLHRRFHKPA